MAKNTVSCVLSFGWHSALVECSIETLQALQNARIVEHSHYDDEGNIIYYETRKLVKVELLHANLPIINKEAHERIMEEHKKAREAEEQQRNAEPAE